MNPRRLSILVVAVFVVAALAAVLTFPLWRSLFITEDDPLPDTGSDIVVSDTLPDLDAEPLLLAVGTFGSLDNAHSGEGTASLYELPDAGWLLRLEDFRVRNQPGLRVVLSVNLPANPTQPLEFGYVDLGALKGNAGNQNYDIPADVDLTRFSGVVITNETFSEHMTAAAFTAG